MSGVGGQEVSGAVPRVSHGAVEESDRRRCGVRDGGQNRAHE